MPLLLSVLDIFYEDMNMHMHMYMCGVCTDTHKTGHPLPTTRPKNMIVTKGYGWPPTPPTSACP